MQQQQERPLAFDHHPQGNAIGFDHAETALPHVDMLNQRSTAV